MKDGEALRLNDRITVTPSDVGRRVSLRARTGAPAGEPPHQRLGHGALKERGVGGGGDRARGREAGI